MGNGNKAVKKVNTKKEKLFLSILIIISAITYANSLFNGFVFDDIVYLKENYSIRSWSESPELFFTSDYFPKTMEASYRPVASLSYFIGYLIWEFNPFGHHLQSLLLHIVNVVLLFLFIKTIIKNKIGAFIGCMVFAVHPIHTETVNCVTYNEDLLTMLFSLIAILLFLQWEKSTNRGKPLFYIGSLISAFMGMLSKEMAVTIPVLIVLTDWITDKSLADTDSKYSVKWKKKMIWYAGYALVTIFYLFIYFIVFQNPDKTPIVSKAPLLERIVYPPHILMQYIRIIVFPVNLNADYQYFYPESFFSLSNLGAVAVISGIMGISIFAYKHNRYLSFGIWWLFLTFLPTLNIIEIFNPIAERYAYFPFAGLAIALSILGKNVSEKIKFQKGSKWIIILLFGVYIIFLAVLTHNRNKVWKDEFTFWSKTVESSPNSYKANNSLGVLYYKKGDYPKAYNYLSKAVRIDDKHVDAIANLGLVLDEMGRYYEAIIQYKKVIQLNPNHAITYNNMGYTYYKLGKPHEATKAFQKAIQINDAFPDAHNNLGAMYYQSGQLEEAKKEFKKALMFDPNHLNALQNMRLFEPKKK